MPGNIEPWRRRDDVGNVIFKGGGMVDLNSGNFSGGNFTYWNNARDAGGGDLERRAHVDRYGGDCTYTMNSPARRPVGAAAAATRSLAGRGTLERGI